MSKQVENPIPLLDEIKLRAKVLIPILRALRIEMVKDRADGLVARALSEWLRSVQGNQARPETHLTAAENQFR